MHDLLSSNQHQDQLYHVIQLCMRDQQPRNQKRLMLKQLGPHIITAITILITTTIIVVLTEMIVVAKTKGTTRVQFSKKQSWSTTLFYGMMDVKSFYHRMMLFDGLADRQGR
ncbi:uncharacterized protein LOC134245333 [Saccostrea cucullata]|uniref:uncharacterized protein LOC134245333 n=1 Tax=Saccostrea cuccullata TaxID=36930 RepID=UPI002ED1D1C7